MNAVEACKIMSKKFRINSESELLQVSNSVQYHWQVLGCSRLISFPSINSNIESMSSTSGRNGIIEEVDNHANIIRGPTSVGKETEKGNPSLSRGPTESEGGMSLAGSNSISTISSTKSTGMTTTLTCKRMMREHHVVPGASWGTLPDAMQK